MIDDEIDVADVLMIGLERLGYDVVAINDPLEALDAFAETPTAWDIVIVDQMMPSVRGTDLIERLREIRPDILAVIYSGNSDDDLSTRPCLTDRYLTKRIEVMELAAEIRTLIDGAALH